MYLHLTHDDKFIDYFINDAKKYSASINKYIIVADPEKPLRHVKSEGVHVATLKSERLFNLIGDFTQYKAVFFHYPEMFYEEIINKFPSTVKLVWVFWGSEAFSLPLFDKLFLMPQTYAVNKNLSIPAIINFDNKINFKNVIPILKYLKNKNFYAKLRQREQDKKIEFLNRFQYFAHYIPEDYNILKDSIGLKAVYMDYSYQTSGFAEIHSPDTDIAISKNILVGNSAADTNNHIEVFGQLKKIAHTFPDDTKIIVPLSYSGHKDYVNYIVKLGKKYFGEKFLPLTDFITKEEYNKLLLSCASCVFNHLRSQAGGNIYAGVNYGKRIFMQEKSSLYKLYKDNGAIIYSIDTDLLNKPALLITPPEQKEIEVNKSVLNKLFGEDKVKERYYNLLSI